jgi:hypothetical protein
VLLKQRLHFDAQFWLSGARLAQVTVTFFRVTLECARIHGPETFRILGGH